MFLDRPHLRFDGLYVSRNTYIKRGIVEWCSHSLPPISDANFTSLQSLPCDGLLRTEAMQSMHIDGLALRRCIHSKFSLLPMKPKTNCYTLWLAPLGK